jgi:hypothetical protein
MKTFLDSLWLAATLWLIGVLALVLKVGARIFPGLSRQAKLALISRLDLPNESPPVKTAFGGLSRAIPLSWATTHIILFTENDEKDSSNIDRDSDILVRPLEQIGLSASLIGKGQMDHALLQKVFSQNVDQVVFVNITDLTMSEIVKVAKVLAIRMSTQPSVVFASAVVRRDEIVRKSDFGDELRETLVPGQHFGISKIGFRAVSIDLEHYATSTNSLRAALAIAASRRGISIEVVPCSLPRINVRSRFPNSRIEIPETLWADQTIASEFRDLQRQNLLADTLALVSPAEGIEVDLVRENILVIMPISGGGAHFSAIKNVAELAETFSVYVIDVEGDQVHVSKHGVSGRITICLGKTFTPQSHRSNEFDRIIALTIVNFDIRGILVQHMFNISLGLGDVAKLLGVPYFLENHDFYALCPSHNLLDENNVFCGGHCTAGVGKCSTSLWHPSDFPFLKNGSVHYWRANFEKLYSGAAMVFAPSPAAAQIIQSNISASPEVVVTTISGATELGEIDVPGYARDKMLRIVVLGDINIQKGLHFLEQLALIPQLEIHLFGSCMSPLPNSVVRHGRYEPHELSTLVGAVRPHCGLIPSTSFETYSHVLSEFWQLGVPTFASTASGAVADRIKRNAAGFLFDAHDSIDNIHNFILSTLSDAVAVEDVKSSMRNADLGFPESRTISEAILSITHSS